MAEQNNGTGFRTWWVPQIPGKPFLVEVADAAQGRWLENVLADYDLFQYSNRIKPDYANAGGTEEWSETEHDWSEVYDEED